MDLALNNLQKLICHGSQTNKQTNILVRNSSIANQRIYRGG